MRLLIMLVLIALLAACNAGNAPAVPTPTPQLANTLTLYNWAEYMPQSVLEAFTAEYGVKVKYEVYDTQEEAAENISAGKVYDVVVMPPELIPGLIQEGLLAKINHRNVPNFKNISANFRDLLFDHGNKYSIPFHWGTSGLLVRTDLVKEPVTRWADLWRPEFAGKVALWPIPRDLFPIALKVLGYSVNTANRSEIDEALAQLIDLKQRAILIDPGDATITPALTDGRAVIAHGWAYDAWVARESGLPIEYILPAEGTYLWGDNFVIPANSPNQYTAELFLNFLLRPEISAQIINESSYAMPNEPAERFVDPDVLSDPLVYPPTSALQNAEVVMPLNAEGQNLYEDAWARFVAAQP
jgi:spermidine/putrescine transport system substrate-binding protein